MKKKLDELSFYLDQFETKNKSVSSASVGWHINHSLLVMNGVGLSLMRSKEEDYIKKFNIKRMFIFMLGKFPKGKAQAPKATNEKEEEITLAGIEKQLATSLKLLNKLEPLPPNRFFKHPLFGTLSLKESKKFLNIHTEHHLKIIRDILK